MCDFVQTGDKSPERGTAFHPAESMSVTEHAREFLRRRCCAAYGDEFFLYEKMGRRAIDHEGNTNETGGNKFVQTCPHNPQKTGFQRDASLWQVLEGRALEVLPFGSAEILNRL